jgi:nucleoid-associated protein YgaU
VSGDTPSKIAEKSYGDASLYPRTFDANRQVPPALQAASVK